MWGRRISMVYVVRYHRLFGYCGRVICPSGDESTWLLSRASEELMVGRHLPHHLYVCTRGTPYFTVVDYITLSHLYIYFLYMYTCIYSL